METIRFEDLELDAKIMRAITDMGFEAASPIQGQAIPLELQGLDIIGQAQTGTGKTAAFGIPLLQKIDPKNKKPQAIILCPTRELAIQVSEEIRRLAKYMHGVKVLPIYGGQEIGRQIRSLKDGVQVIIGTPGRVMDHMRRKTVKMDQIHTVVLDEADEMLNMGFRGYGNHLKRTAGGETDADVLSDDAAGDSADRGELPERSADCARGQERADRSEGNPVLL